MNLDAETEQQLFDYLLRIGDDRLILSHRLSEWCGHAPILEEDIALTNVALDLMGQAEALLTLAGKVEGKGRSEDDLAFLRDTIDFRNCELVEQPRGDFGITVARQFIFDVFSLHLFEALKESSFQELAAIAEKSLKEVRYHVRHSGEWVLRLGDGTEESHERIQAAFDTLWQYTGELFENDPINASLLSKGIAADPTKLRSAWDKQVNKVFSDSTLVRPSDDCFMKSGSRSGRHSEHLGHLLAEMQILPRSHPGAQW